MSAMNSSARDVDVDLGRLFASLARDWKRILLVAVVVSGLAFVLASLATPAYRAETQLFIEMRESVFTRPQTDAAGANPLLDQEGVSSQVEIITSTNLLKQVAKKFDLASLPEFNRAGGGSFLGQLLVLAGLKSDVDQLPAEERVLETFRSKLNVYRVENTRVIAIAFSSEDPELAAEVPTAIAEAYLQFSRDAKQQSNTAATEWLEPEIQALTAKVKEAEGRVAAYRSQSDLLVGQNNSVLATQQLSELSTELSRTRANRAAAEANAESVRLALRNGSLDAFPDVVSSNLIQRLRERQVQLRADIADLSTTLLDNHPRIRALRSQLADLDSQVSGEAQKILQSLANAAESARLREAQLVAELNRLKAESSRVGEKEVELRALEREAAAQRELLESYLARYREAASRRDGDYLPADARIISPATVPVEPYFPKIVPIVGAAFAGSLLLMGIATLLRELFSGRAMRPAEGAQVMPVEQIRMPDPSPADTPGAGGEGLSGPVPLHGEVSPHEAAEMLIAGGASRALFVSPEGDEAAAAAVMVARDVADAGLRVLLVDLTAMGAASAPMLDDDSLPGITDLLTGEAKFVDAIHSDQYSDCHVIPVGRADQRKAMQAVDRLPAIMDTLTAAYDVVIVECGPASAESIRRLVSEGTEVLVSVIEPAESVLAARDDLAAKGYEGLTLVTPADYANPPEPDRSAA
ncbi:Wzz/FepE/Etk N-terminal domain-containing protein [Mesorhizobium sp. LHD-90]|uniref:Wzz/FepE/Etk N-terminal domain-containing protein n=1 Tax=Mesorhizobium sp. LHD-90 TaxID=3071414 RepID=UPI0027E126AA|nr:Wzz/FepE/Etk N-terminal domain-containing protein [Mesorhizobium sp. LHD-90]MDQ6434578.1 Wzz/FepE/Etk N-terminal domain-containing protein [Mesorhizobium sp. LHD-90]